MKTIKWRKTETIDLERNDYFAVIDTVNDEYGLRLDVYLVSKVSEVEITVGSYISRDYDFAACYFEAFKLLNNDSYCRKVLSDWEGLS